MSKNRERGWAGIFVVLLALFLYGCASPAEITDEPPRFVDSTEEPVSQIGQGGTARIALPLSTEPDCLNPYLSACSGSEYLDGILFEGLLAVGPSGDYRPLLARSIPSYSDGSLKLEPATIRIRLREDATFSDGEPVTAGDVKWTYEQAAALAEEGSISSPYAGFRHVEEVRVEGSERKVAVIELDRPYSEWRRLLAAPVLPEHVYGEREGGLGAMPLTSEPVGSGPFRLSVFEEDGISFTASPRYRTGDELKFPRLDGLEVHYRAPSEVRSGLASGATDFALFAGKHGSSSASVLRGEGTGSRTEVLLFNSGNLGGTERSFLSDALDRAEVSEAAGLQLSHSLFDGRSVSEEVPAWPSSETEERSGFEEGSELRLVYPVGGPERDRAAERVSSELRDAGVDVDLNRLSRADFYGDALVSGDFDLALFDVDSLASYEAVERYLPERSATVLSATLEAVEDESRHLARTQRVMHDDSALVPLYRWPDSYAWSSTLSGPRSETPATAVLGNVRDWGFYK